MANKKEYLKVAKSLTKNERAEFNKLDNSGKAFKFKGLDYTGKANFPKAQADFIASQNTTNTTKASLNVVTPIIPKVVPTLSKAQKIQSEQARKFDQSASLDPSDLIAPGGIAAGVGLLAGRKGLGKLISKIPFKSLLNRMKGIRELPSKLRGKTPFKTDLSKLQEIPIDKNVTQPLNYRRAPEDITSIARQTGQRLIEGMSPKDVFKKTVRANRVVEEIVPRRFSDVTAIPRRNPLRLNASPADRAKKAAFEDIKKEGKDIRFRKKK